MDQVISEKASIAPSRSEEIMIDIGSSEPEVASGRNSKKRKNKKVATSSDPDPKVASSSNQVVRSIGKILSKIQSGSESQCSICKVPKSLRSINAKAYIPQVISIGPFHKGKEGLEVMELHKHRYLQSFLSRANLNVENVVELVKSWEERARSCYAEPIKMSSDKLVKLILVDGCFIVEYFIRQHPNYVGEIDHLFRYNLFPDLMKLENQLPFFVLDGLFQLYQPNDHLNGISFFHLFCTIAGFMFRYNLTSNSNVELSPDHFVGILCNLFALDVNLNPCAKNYVMSNKILQSPTATQLYEAGVKFNKVEKFDTMNVLANINFRNGVLEIPPIEIFSDYETYLRNLIAYEQSYMKIYYLSFFAIFMDSLINTDKDVALLIKAGIISNYLGSNEDVSKLFNNICKHVNAGGENYLNQVCIDMKTYCQQPWHSWMASFRRKYLNTPWAVMSISAASILLLLTLLQTIFAIMKP